MKPWVRLSLIAVMLGTMLFGAVKTVRAAEFINDGTIEAGETIDDDVFLSAENVVMDGTVNGILFAAGNTVTINGTVNGDAILGASEVVIGTNAVINGNLFWSGYSLELKGKVTGSLFGGAAMMILDDGASVDRNLFYGGYSFEAMPESLIGRDAYIGGYQATFSGEVSRDANLGGAAIEINGKVGGDVNVDLGEVENNENVPISPMTFMQQPGMPPLPEMKDPGLRVAKNAEITGKLTYISNIEMKQIDTVPAGGLVFVTPTPMPQGDSGTSTGRSDIVMEIPVVHWIIERMRELIALLVFGALALWLIPAVLYRTVEQARTKMAPAAGYGFVVIVVGSLGALMALVILLVVGLILGVATLGSVSGPLLGVTMPALAVVSAVFSFLVGTGSKVVVSYLIGQLLVGKAFPQLTNPKLWALIFGVIIYVLIGSIPLLGWLVGLAATLIGVGAMWLAFQSWRKPAASAAAMMQTPAAPQV
jgi:cytoskeletal protein CcmA (bactofilin family)